MVRIGRKITNKIIVFYELSPCNSIELIATIGLRPVGWRLYPGRNDGWGENASAEKNLYSQYVIETLRIELKSMIGTQVI